MCAVLSLMSGFGNVPYFVRSGSFLNKREQIHCNHLESVVAGKVIIHVAEPLGNLVRFSYKVLSWVFHYILQTRMFWIYVIKKAPEAQPLSFFSAVWSKQLWDRK